MEDDAKIIAIRRADKAQAHRCFTELMERTERIMNDAARTSPSLYKNLSASDLEEVSVRQIMKACECSPFDANDVRLISGQRFPDIIASTYYGVEVKSTKSDQWTSTGSSIVESTRNVNVENIYMLFGKMGGMIPEFRCRPYEDVLYDIAVTHSPRYLINMDLGKSDTIFSKMGTSYESLRASKDPIRLVRHYYKEKAVRERKQEMPWWITSENVESSQSFNIKLWNTLSDDVKKDLQAKCMILFPEALNPAPSQTKYNQTTLWLCSYMQVIVPNIRDFYSAGGRITHVNGRAIRPQAAQVFARIVKFSDEIHRQLSCPTQDLISLIEDYNPQLLKGGRLYENWLDICLTYAQAAKVPLAEWIEDRPAFTFSTR